MISAVSDSLIFTFYTIKFVVVIGGMAVSASARYPMQPFAIPPD